MKFSKYPSDVEGVGIRGKENAWVGIVLPCHLGIVMCTAKPHVTSMKLYPTERLENGSHLLQKPQTQDHKRGVSHALS